MTPALEASIAEFRYPRSAQPALQNIDLTIQRGEFVVLTGPAGSGKTTLCYCLAGVIPHFTNGFYEGVVRLDGRDLAGLRLPEIAGLVGFVFQRPENQLFNLTVEEDIAFGPENLCLPANEIRSRLGEALDLVGMRGFARRESGSLSGGETQRVVLGSILSMDPGILVLDQPAAALDPAGRAQVYENLGRLCADSGKTIVLVESRLSEVAPFASRFILLDQGRIVRDASPDDFFAAGVAMPCPAVTRFMSDCFLEAGSGPVPLTRGIKGVYLPVESPNPPSPPLIRYRTPLAPLIRGERRTSPLDKGDLGGSNGQPTPALQVTNLSFRYPKSAAWALRDINLTIYRGEFVAILGENGAGKTTLAKHFAALLRPTKGLVLVCGQDTAKVSPARLSGSAGYLFQDPDYQIFCSSVFDEVAFSLKIRKVPRRQIAGRVEAMLDRLGLLEARDDHPYRLRPGQRQALALASIIVHGPQILIVDEPTTGLDHTETRQVMEVLEEFTAGGGTVVMITHDTKLAHAHAGRLITMAQGCVLHDGSDTPATQIHPLESQPGGFLIGTPLLHQSHF